VTAVKTIAPNYLKQESALIRPDNGTKLSLFILRASAVRSWLLRHVMAWNVW